MSYDYIIDFEITMEMDKKLKGRPLSSCGYSTLSSSESRRLIHQLYPSTPRSIFKGSVPNQVIQTYLDACDKAMRACGRSDTLAHMDAVDQVMAGMSQGGKARLLGAIREQRGSRILGAMLRVAGGLMFILVSSYVYYTHI